MKLARTAPPNTDLTPQPLELRADTQKQGIISHDPEVRARVGLDGDLRSKWGVLWLKCKMCS